MNPRPSTRWPLAPPPTYLIGVHWELELGRKHAAPARHAQRGVTPQVPQGVVGCILADTSLLLLLRLLLTFKLLLLLLLLY